MKNCIATILAAAMAAGSLGATATTYYARPWLANTVENASTGDGASAWNTNTVYRLGTASGTMEPVPVNSGADDDEETVTGSIPAVSLVNAKGGYSRDARPKLTYATGTENPIPLPTHGLWTAKNASGALVANMFTLASPSAFAVKFDYDDTNEADLGWHFHTWVKYTRAGYSDRSGTTTAIAATLLAGNGDTHTVYCNAEISDDTTFPDIYRYPIFWPILAKNTYSVKFDANGGEFPSTGAPATLTVTNGVAATLPAASLPSRVGCTFLGWALTSGATAEDVLPQTTSFTATTANPYSDGEAITLYAAWDYANFEVELAVSPEGAGTVSGAGTYTVADAFSPTATAAEGWTFLKWSPALPPMIVSNSLYTAVFAANEYKVRFNPNGGDGTIYDQTHHYGTAQSLTANTGHITRTHYDFAGWAYSADATEPDFIDAQEVLNLSSTKGAIVQLYAVWRKHAYQIDIAASPTAGGAVAGAVSGARTAGETISLSAESAKGYVFSGWSDGVASASRTVTVEGALSLTANFTPAAYSVVFERADGTSVTNSVATGASVKAPASETGWTVAVDGDTNIAAPLFAGGVAVSNLVAEAGGTITFAEAAAATSHRVVSFTAYASPAECGTVSSSILPGTYPTNVTAVLAAKPAAGCAFAGWSDGWTDEDAPDSLSRTVTVDSEGLSFTALFKVYGAVTATFDGSEAVEWHTGDTVTLAAPDAESAPEGCTFAGWWTSNAATGEQVTAATIAALLAEGESQDFALVSRWSKPTAAPEIDETGRALGLDSLAARHLTDFSLNLWSVVGDGEGVKTSAEIDSGVTAILSAKVSGAGALAFRYKTFKDYDAVEDATGYAWRSGEFFDGCGAGNNFVSSGGAGSVVLASDTSGEWAAATNTFAGAAETVAEVSWRYANPLNFTVSDYAWAMIGGIEWIPAPVEWAKTEGATIVTEGVYETPETMVEGDIAEHSLEIDGPGVLSFEWKTPAAPAYENDAGELVYTDTLTLLVDGKAVLTVANLPDWTPCAWTNTLDGAHTCTWRFTRGECDMAGIDGNVLTAEGGDVLFAHTAALRLGEEPFAALEAPPSEDGQAEPGQTESKRLFANVRIEPLPALVYAGEALEPALTVTDGGEAVDSAEYTLSYASNTAPGVATVTIAPAADGSYEGDAIEMAFTIFAGAIAGQAGETSFDCGAGGGEFVFEPSVAGATVRYAVDGGEFSGEAPSFVHAGTYSVIVLVEEDGYEPYAELVEVVVAPQDISSFAASLVPDQTEWAWTGLPIMPGVEVAGVETNALALVYANNVAPGEATLTVRGQGDCTGEIELAFTIVPPEIALAFESVSAAYDGTAKSLAEATATPSWAAITYSGDLSSDLSATAAGTYSVTATATADGYATATATATLTIARRSIANATIAAIADQTYTGGAITPSVAVTDEALATTLAAADYSVSYSNNVEAGTATVTLTGKGNYTGTKSATFKIVKSGGDEPGPGPEPEPDVELRLATATNAYFRASAATKFNGYVYDQATGDVAGTVLLQVAKANKKTYASKFTAKVTLAATAKAVTLKGVWNDTLGEAAEATSGAYGIALEIFEDSFTGTFTTAAGEYEIDGARNVFLGKIAEDKSDAAAALAAWKGTYAVSVAEGMLSLTVGAKGAVRVKGVSASGANVSASGMQLCVADSRDVAAVPVVLPKLGAAFVLWLGDGGAVEALQGAEGVAARHDSGKAFGALAVELGEDFPTAISGVPVVANLLPDGTVVTAAAKKWTIPTGGAPKYVDGAFVPKNAANPAMLKLTYTAATGLFKGSFAVWTAAEGATKAKKTTVTVRGMAVGDDISGSAILLKVPYSFKLVQ